MSQGKHWCFTLNNWTSDEYEQLSAIGHDRASCGVTYLVIGKEVGGSQGTPHLQGFVSLSKRKRLQQVKELLGNRVHLERARGKPHQAATYCKKDGDFVEFGDCPGGAGSRSDLDAVVELVKRKRPLSEIADEYPNTWTRHCKGIISLRNLLDTERRHWKTTVYVYWGATNTGKTRKAHEETTDPYVHSGGKWFCGYEGQEDVIFDDFTGSELRIQDMLKILDRYPHVVEIKGGKTEWKPKRIFITSNLDPRKWYKGAHKEHQAALMRRLDVIEHFGDNVFNGVERVE